MALMDRSPLRKQKPIAAIGTVLILLVSQFTTPGRASSSTDEENKLVAKRAIDWLLYNDWGRESPPALHEWEDKLVARLREDLRRKNVLFIRITENGPADRPTSDYIYDVSHRTLLDPAAESRNGNNNADLYVETVPKGTGVWQARLGRGGLDFGIAVKKDGQNYVADRLLWAFIDD